ncbi:hypothetical protein FRB95_001139 [Tulasnella sp. JGI-2019a]|nr:hypothetical protein FRB95_001139 [Tulasnella sp. JGI-2019a]
MPAKDKPEKPEDFGEKGDYWSKYNALADSKDKVMIDRLNSDLDVLLIFAGLFSAVNTAFIVLTLASLSAPPSYRTEALLILIVMQVGNSTLTPNDLNPSFSPTRAAIRQNCTFFASLCASILAAAGAMLAKQWLQSYQRTGQTGSHQKQALLRTQKWMGAESWRLRPVIEALPTLLLISLALFFAALCDLLWSTSQSVAIVVIVFTVVGAVFYGFTVIAAAVHAFCPYQTAMSRIIRELSLGLLASKSSLWSNITRRLQTCCPSITKMVKRIDMTTHQLWKSVRGENTAKLCHNAWMLLGGDLLQRWIMQTGSKLYHEETANTGADIICAYSILWMLENATEEEDILSCAEHIPTLTTLSSTLIVSQSPLFSTLVRRFDAAVTGIHNAIEGSEQSALVFGKAVMHVVVADPMRWAEPVASALTSGPTEIWSLRGDLWALCASAYLARRAIGPSPPYEASFLKCIIVKRGKLFSSFDNYYKDRPTAVISAFQPSTTLALYSAMRLSPHGILFDVVDLGTVHQDAIINMLCLEVIDLAAGSQPSLDQRVGDVRVAQNGENVVDHIMKAVEAHDRQISHGVGRRGLLLYHTEVLRYCRSSRLGRGSETHAQAIKEHLSRVIAHCRLTTDDPIPVTEVEGWWKLLGWKERLSKDPLLPVERLQTELTAYATQLLLYLVALLSDNYQHGFTSEDAPTLVDAVTKLQGRVVTDMDLAYVLKAIDLVISSGMITNLTQRFESVSPILTRAFGSTSDNVLDAAWGVLAAFGDMAWRDIDKPKTDAEFLLTPEFGSAALRSLSRLLIDWSSNRHRPLCLWLAASIRLDTVLATTFDESTITSMFVSRLLGTLENKAEGDWNTMWNIAYTFLKTWHSTAPNTVSFDTEKSLAMGDAALKSLVGYAENRLCDIRHDTTNVEIFVLIADFVQKAFLLRPTAALFYRLDIACERLIQRTKVWEEDMARKRDISGDDTTEGEAELVTLVLPFSRARRVYTAASLSRDETLQYAHGAGWWRRGGLSRSCEILRPTMT